MTDQFAKQEQLQGVIERSLSNFKKIGKPKLTPATVRSRIANLKQTWDQYLNGHAALTKTISKEQRTSHSYFTDEVFESTEDVYDTTLDHMAEELEKLEPPSGSSSGFTAPQGQAPSSTFSLQHLPPINLPPFDGNVENWEQFRDRFAAIIINNRDLNNFARMHFLTSCVTGRARECIRDIPIKADNFDQAWQALVSRYENKRRLLKTHLSSLLNLPALSRESANELSALRDKVNVAVASLKLLDRTPEQLWDDTIVHLIVQKLDLGTRKAWNLKTGDTDDPPSFDELSRFISSRARALEDFSAGFSVKNPSKASIPKINAATASTSISSGCPICKADHRFSLCVTFTNAGVQKRRDLVKQHRRCFNCLSHTHAAKECPSKYSCRKCQRKHHTLLHLDSEATINSPDTSVNTSEPSSQVGSPEQVANRNSEVHSLLASAKSQSNLQILLATAWVTVSEASGRSITVRALLDQGSERTFISESLAQLLRVKRLSTAVAVSAVGGINAGTVRHAASVSISPRESPHPTVATNALILSNLTTYAPKRVAIISRLQHLANLQWADTDPTNAAPISIIIGADLYSEVILEGLRKGKKGQPVAQKTIFGWVISGPVETRDCTVLTTATHGPIGNISVHHCQAISSLDEEIKKFWTIEEVPRKAILSTEDALCENHFRITHSRQPDGRYIVRLPFKSGPPIDIGESRGRAEKLLGALSRRLKNHPDQKKEYSDFLIEYETLGHMRRAPANSKDRDQRNYIPHHSVLREGSTTTHLSRVVFNASSPTSNGSSLNDHLFAGPKLQTDLPAIILRWRNFKYVYTADIAKMYRQIRIDDRDLNYQRILWNVESDKMPIDYQLLTVTYGMACAPFLALRVLRQLTEDEGSKFPRAAAILRDHIYVDDILFGGDDCAQLSQTREQLISLLKLGGFELRKWASNSPTLLQNIDADNHGLACTKSLAVDEKLKILGIGWNPSLDVFQFSVALEQIPPESKRSVLSAIARLYDPLGWVTPVTITAKIFMQRLWLENLNWDDTIPAHLLSSWQRIYSKLSALNGLQIHRWTAVETDILHAELHGFADASNVAYAAAVYLKVVSSSGKITITLLAGKSRVAPLTPLSIPRLELSAAVLLARLVEFIRETLSLSLSCFCWTVVLAWINQDPSRWKTFVANRVVEIHSRLPGVKWQHVATGDNPADCASRGLLGDELQTHSLWWHGPVWLQGPHDTWPQNAAVVSADAPLEEKIVSAHCTRPPNTFDLASRFSSWSKLIRVTAYIIRFVKLCRQRRGAPRVRQRETEQHVPSLTAVECDNAQTFWTKRIQLELFPAEIFALSTGKELSSKSSILSLRPFVDHDGVLRVGGRLRNASSPLVARQPILLASHPLVTLIVDQTHKQALHAGLQLTLSTLRRHYWILRARSIVRIVIHKCVVCVRERAAVPSQLMGDLPAVRVNAPTRSFQHCGLDYAGPVLVRASAGRGIASRKAYIALFICLATRAIHLELVSDYSTQAFLSAFIRFCSRRGLPQSVYSDNGTTFVGADRELQIAFRSALRDPTFQNSTATDHVSWHFLPPSAPHFGGLWEAGVRSVKHHLRRILKNHMLTFEEFTTLLCKVEACLNSRPLTPLSDSLDDYDVLTPGHFLIGTALTAAPEPSVLNINENRLTRWQLIRQLSEQFWRIWHNDYVNTLQQRFKWRKKQPSIEVGRLVLLRSPTLPPCKWEIGRVTKCHPGPDGLTRVVTVKTSTSEYKRPLVKLCLLPVSSASTSD